MDKKNKRARFTVIFLLAVVVTLSIVGALETKESSYGPPIEKSAYSISRSKIERTLEKGEVFIDSLTITNIQGGESKITISPSPEVESIFEFPSNNYQISPANSTEITLHIIGKEPGNFAGKIKIAGDITEDLPVNITIVNGSKSTPFMIDSYATKKTISPDDKIDITLKIIKILNKEITNVTITYTLFDKTTNKSYELGMDTFNINQSQEIRKQFVLPPQKFADGPFSVYINSMYKEKNGETKTEFDIATPFLKKKLFGIIPLWILLIATVMIILSLIAFIFIRRYIESKKKYRMALDLKTLAVKNDRTLWLGKIAEKNLLAYMDADAFTTHGVVAGATGGGKSIAAQSIIEEALMKNIAVVVFDPTAQWSGMLRKCEDKKMMSFYPNFGLKPSDAKAFQGNVRQIKNARQKIDLKKYIHPGQIQIFTMNKLDPKEIDLFVATVIASIFRSDPEEFPVLRVMLVFDEVHRLLPKFGGSGKGFLQIERACREFRKWGFGVMLVSQVLSDFVGEIKANINTEIQMRTRDESDLNRIKTKYGEDFLQSLIKASVGVGMFVNPRYNRGRPYFVQFRPILHNTRRLSDEILDKYNNYGDTIDDLEYQMDQLEKEKIDVFDLRMELKLVKDKLMTGNFSVVDIYLEGLKPRLEKNWQNLGKTPLKKEIELVAIEDIEASLKDAAKGREEFRKKQEAEEKEVNKKVDNPLDKMIVIITAFTFDNGAMISSVKELVDFLPTMEDEVYKIHVNAQKNEIADWLSKTVSPELGEVIRNSPDRNSMKNEIIEFYKNGLKKTDKQIQKEKEFKDAEMKKNQKDEGKTPSDAKMPSPPAQQPQEQSQPIPNAQSSPPENKPK